jgi:hypothetical protein
MALPAAAIKIRNLDKRPIKLEKQMISLIGELDIDYELTTLTWGRGIYSGTMYTFTLTITGEENIPILRGVIGEMTTYPFSMNKKILGDTLVRDIVETYAAHVTAVAVVDILMIDDG